MIREIPILFSDAMVRAILDGSKTETRRVIKQQRLDTVDESLLRRSTPRRRLRYDFMRADLNHEISLRPFAVPGDLLYVREAWFQVGDVYMDASGSDRWSPSGKVYFRADGVERGFEPDGRSWRRPMPSIHLPKRASRLWLRVTSVRVERLHDITGDGAIREGVVLTPSVQNLALVRDPYRSAALVCFQDLWIEINGAESWAANPWVWVVQFERTEKPSGKETTK